MELQENVNLTKNIPVDIPPTSSNHINVEDKFTAYTEIKKSREDIEHFKNKILEKLESNLLIESVKSSGTAPALDSHSNEEK